jgi:hypothetical protein
MPRKLQTHRKYDRRNLRKKKVNRRRTYKKRINKFKGGGNKPVYYVGNQAEQIIPGKNNIDIATAQENYVEAGVRSLGDPPILFLSERLEILYKLVTEIGISPEACILMRTYNVSGATKVLETAIDPSATYEANKLSINDDIAKLFEGGGNPIPTLGLYEIKIIEDKGGILPTDTQSGIQARKETQEASDARIARELQEKINLETRAPVRTQARRRIPVRRRIQTQPVWVPDSDSDSESNYDYNDL